MMRTINMENFSSPSATATCGAVRRAAAMLLTVIMAFAGAQAARAQTNVSTDDELRTAIATNGANIIVTADINLSNSTLEIKENTAVTIDLGGHTLNRNLKWRCESGGQVITIRENAILNLSNGTLKGGWGGSGGGIQNYGTANLTGVTIKDNIGDDRGGGICNYGTMTIDGGTITGNKARKLGGGIWSNGTLNVKGAITLTGNTASSGMVNNLYLTHSAIVTVTGSLEGSNIGMSLQDVNGTFTSGYSTHNSGAPSTVFFGDLSEIVTVSTDASNEVQLESTLAEGSIYYIERSWDSENKVVTAEIRVLEEGQYDVLAGSDDERTIGYGYHVVKNNISVNGVNVSINGNDDTSYLILCDGAKLTTPYVCVKNEDASGQFHIFGQMGDTGEIYNKYIDKDDDYPGVGSMGYGCTINIHGGQFEIEAGSDAAGIGGGKGSCGGTLNIFGGEFDVKGGGNAAGIGGGNGANCNNINIYGGRIYAYSEETNGGAGIGGSQNAPGGTVSISGGTVSISGGSITTTGIEASDITLGWNSATDYIDVGSYSSPVTIADGQRFVAYNGTTPTAIVGSGTVDVSIINSKQLCPLDGYLVTSDDANVTIGSGTPTLTIGGTDYYAYASGDNVTLGHGTREGYDFVGYTATGVSLASGATSFTMPTSDVTVSAVWADTNDFTVNADGSYTIKTAAGWNAFCDLLAGNAKGYFDGKTVKLGANISVTRMAGADGYEFTGTFDGDGHTLTVSYGSSDSPITEDYAAPFRYVDGGSIENLHVCGTIYTSAKYTGGFIGIAEGSASIVNSVSGVTINSSIEGEGAHGGFVGLQGDNEGNTLGIVGCVFNGKLLGASTTSCGGFVGWGKKTVYISNSLYAPAAATGSETWIDTEGCATFSRNSASINNCYYTQTLGNAQVYQARTISAGEGVTVAHAGVATTYGVSGITAYKASAESSSFTDGLLYNNVLYAGWRDAVSLTLANTPPTGYSFGGYTTYTTSPDGAMLTRDGDNYTLTMPDADVTIGATFMEPVSVSYIDADGKEQTVVAIPLQGGGATMLPAGWYVVNSNVTYTGIVTLGGDVNIILADGKTMTVKTYDEYGIKGTSNALTIYGQTLGTGTLNATDPIGCAFTMIGGNVNATSNPYAIRGNVTVSGGTLNATGHIAIYGNVTVTGGTLTVTSTEGLARRRSDWTPGYNKFAIYGNLALSGPATFTLNGYVYDDVTIADGLTFTTDGTDSYSGTLGIEDQIAINGKTLRLAALQLADAADNTAIIAKCNGVTGIDVTLSDRTLYCDGAWNTLCLPFAMTAEQIAASPLAGADIRALSTTIEYEGATTGFNPATGTLTLNFTPAAPASGAVTAIEAGVPYIVKWPVPDGMTPEDFAAAYAANPAAYDLQNPLFHGVTITAGLNDVAFTSGAFKGTFGSTTLPAGDASNLYLGAGNTLYWPSADKTIGAFRAYFHLANGQQARAFSLHFGDENDATGIRSMDNGQWIMDNCWYDMQGRKLSKKPTQKGIYIKNGKKIIIK